MSAVSQRAAGVIALVIAGMLSLPLSAAVLDGRSTENLTFPAQLLVMALIGAGLAYAIPGRQR